MRPRTTLKNSTCRKHSLRKPSNSQEGASEPVTASQYSPSSATTRTTGSTPTRFHLEQMITAFLALPHPPNGALKQLTVLISAFRLRRGCSTRTLTPQMVTGMAQILFCKREIKE